ncbi:MAG TPA: hemolysin III family protein [Cyclobacteriaceae bacterium]|nr:hemolysin III family protein [Cyclobacteriaceae bacterium]
MSNVVQAHRPQSLGEEIANSISHGLGFLGAAAVTPILIIAAVPSGTAAVVGASVFCTTMMMLYLSSTLYHAFPASRTKRIFQIFDHGSIFLLIAGTYTPFTLTVLDGEWGWTLFGIVWALAIFGVVLKSVDGARTNKLSIALYLGMGWLAILAAQPLWNGLSAWGIFWLLAGGIMYSLGVIFFAYDHRIRYSHFIWHIFVIAGTTFHVVAILGYVY